MAAPAAAVWRPLVTEILRERIGGGEPTWLSVRGRSMRPRLARGTRILVASVPRVRRGDLLAYECAGRIVCHRVVGRRRGLWLTRADHGGGAPERVTPGQVVGVVVALERDGGVVDLTTPDRRALAWLAAVRSLAAGVGVAVRGRGWRPWRRAWSP